MVAKAQLLLRLRSKSGTTLVELITVLLIVVIASGAVISLFVGLVQVMFNSSQQLNQIQSIEQVYGFSNLRIASTDRARLGVESGSIAIPLNASWPGAGIIPANRIVANSLSGDQFIFRRGDFCYRIFYRGPGYASAANRNTLNVAIAAVVPGNDCTALRMPNGSSLGRVRGPNETVPGAGANPPTPGVVASGSVYFDPVLDLTPGDALTTRGIRIVELGSGLVPLEPPNAGNLTGAVPVFTYLSKNYSNSGSSLLHPELNAAGYYSTQAFNSDGFWATAPATIRNQIDAVAMSFRVLGAPERSIVEQQITPKTFKPIFYLNQVCAPSGGVGQ